MIKESTKRRKGFTLIELMLVVAVIAILAAIVIPYVLSSRKAANETSAVASVRQISTVQHQYHTRFGQFATIAELASAGYVSSDLATSEKSGYQFNVAGGDPSSWTISAEPLQPGTTGDRYFYCDETGVIRYADSGPADGSSSPID